MADGRREVDFHGKDIFSDNCITKTVIDMHLNKGTLQSQSENNGFTISNVRIFYCSFINETILHILIRVSAYL